MMKLERPIADQLRDPASEVLLQEAWRGIEARRHKRTRPYWVLAAGLASAMALAGVFLLQSESPSTQALEVADGRPFGQALQTGGEQPALVELSDQSRITITRGARLELGESKPARLHLLLREGKIDLDVRSHGRTAWRIDCGVVTVEVVGTRLSIERRGDGAVVEVREGKVRVSGPRLVPPVQYLEAGERLELSDESAPTADAPAPARPDAPLHQHRDKPNVARPAARAVPHVLDEAPAAKPAPDPKQDDPAEHLRAADAARRQGQPRLAAEHLRLVAAGHDGQAALAALTLGKLLLDDLGDAKEAEAAFVRALELPLPPAMQEIAWARRVEARGRSLDWTGAAGLARGYHERFPQGRFARDVDRWSTP